MSAVVCLAVGLAAVLLFLVWRLERRANRAEDELRILASLCKALYQLDLDGPGRKLVISIVRLASPKCPVFARLTALIQGEHAD
jgi:hypothetical protein